MAYEIKFDKAAIKFLKTRCEKEREKILSSISKLPDSSGVKKMSGFINRYRLRVGDVRVIYEKFDDVFVIVIIDIGNRGDIYKK